ncbi:MAG TPA: condensation domain-containing protein, partial [Pyrinomonadaceae bacterium]
MSELSERIASLSQEKRELLEKLLRKGGVSRQRPAVIPRAGREQTLPLSFAQQRLWFLDQLEPGNPFYNISSPIRFNSAVNMDALRESLTEIIRRHEILRSSFALVDDQPAQIVASSLDLPLPFIDLSGLAPLEREREASRLASLEAQHAFDLARGPLVQAKLVRLSEEQHILLLTMHHIVSDTWSL